MPYYRSVGSVPPKRHTQFRQPGGELYYEEMIGEEGFSSTFSLLYHRHVPAAFSGSDPWPLPEQATQPNYPLRHLHLKLHDLKHEGGAAADAVRDRRLVLGNDDVRISYVTATGASPLYRNAIGDECLYVESGRGRVESVFGSVDAGAGDFVVIPRGTIHRWQPLGEQAQGDEPLRVYCIEASSHIVPPARYLSRYGQLTEFAPYCERDLFGPSQPLLREGHDVPVYTKHRGPGPTGIAGSVIYAARHPFDVEGWAGCLYPFRFNVADFEPVIGRVHQPPPVHQVFEGTGFVVCAFVPRLADYHPDGIPVPYYHVNADSDEVMFYCGGDYAARKGSGIGLGSVSVHPAGLSHGPMPGVMEKALGTTFHQELAIMIDTFRPLNVGEAGLASLDDGYATSAARALDLLSPFEPRDAGPGAGQ
jgi:homogentisate 1,2-dioxygenase